VSTAAALAASCASQGWSRSSSSSPELGQWLQLAALLAEAVQLLTTTPQGHSISLRAGKQAVSGSVAARQQGGEHAWQHHH
jgi:hypothetical protein